MSTDQLPPYDAILFVSFGGPEGKDDVIPFLENVLRGRNVPRERMLEVAEHYYHFDGVSPINAQVRALIEAVTPELREQGIDLPIFWGNRNWHPLLPDVMQQMRERGIRRALAFFTSAYSSYSGCRQYRENVLDAQEQLGIGAPLIEKVRMFFNHPDFVAANVDHLQQALVQMADARKENIQIAFTAHSIPSSMAGGCDYVTQLTETCRLVAESCCFGEEQWKLVYQSRSGRPQDPWLEPDICDYLKELKEQGADYVIVMPIGFLSDHLEVLYDLDTEAKDVCEAIGLNMVRAATVGVHPRFVTMVRKLFQERLDPSIEREAVGQFKPNWDVCPANCCPAPQRPAAGRPQQN